MRASRGVSIGTAKSRLRDIQHEILEATASGTQLTSAMHLLCQRIEELDPSVICSVLSVDDNGLLHPLAAPSLADSYSNALDGIPIGPNVGSCGTAAFFGKPVAVTDIETDPLWAPFKGLALEQGVRACWSSPIKSHDNRVVGTFAFYYREARGPSDFDRMIVDTCVHLCAIAIERESAWRKIHQLAFYDPVTGLPNRVSFQQRAAEIFAKPVRDNELLAVHYLDLDDFKSVNDTLGHHVGDALLKQVGRRISYCIGEQNLVARLGGDEFAIIQRSARHKGEVRALAGVLIEAISQPFDLCGHNVGVRASIGYTIATGCKVDLDGVMRQADLAAYDAKSDGGGTSRMFDPGMLDRAIARRAVEQDLRKADYDREFELFYQPIFSLETEELIGGEALLRWQHPERGLIPPSDFIPVAEQCGLMDRLGDWVIAAACRDASRWPANVMLAINLSAMQFKSPAFALRVVRALKDSGLRPDRVEFEITETALLNDANSARAVLQQFRNVGARIALDDFGTGYSSLSHLREFPIDTIKIDRSFVREFGISQDSTAIIKAVLRLAYDLGMTTTAEGIETVEQKTLLAAAGCARAQGYYFGKPQKRDSFEKLIGMADAAPLHHADRRQMPN